MKRFVSCVLALVLCVVCLSGCRSKESAARLLLKTGFGVDDLRSVTMDFDISEDGVGKFLGRFEASNNLTYTSIEIKPDDESGIDFEMFADREADSFYACYNGVDWQKENGSSDDWNGLDEFLSPMIALANPKLLSDGTVSGVVKPNAMNWLFDMYEYHDADIDAVLEYDAETGLLRTITYSYYDGDIDMSARWNISLINETSVVSPIF